MNRYPIFSLQNDLTKTYYWLNYILTASKMENFRIFSICYNVKFYTDFTQKMIWEPLNCGSFLDRFYLRLHENVVEIALKIVNERI